MAVPVASTMTRVEGAEINCFTPLGWEESSWYAGLDVLISAEDITAIDGRLADADQRLLQSGHLLGDVGPVAGGGCGGGALRWPA